MSSIPWPTNPRIERADGTTVPVELVYEGIDTDGLYCFTGTVIFDPLNGDSFVTDTLPTKTSIALQLPEDSS